MKRFLCIVLVLSTILALSACGKNKQELPNTQATEITQSVEEEKREYYSNYLSNNDFGYDGDVISASVTSDVYTMDVKISEKGMIFTIGNNAFIGCSNLKAINMNDKIETISDSAFENCYSLSSKITFPTTIKSIGTKAFLGDVKIEKITFQSSSAPRLGID